MTVLHTLQAAREALISHEYQSRFIAMRPDREIPTACRPSLPGAHLSIYGAIIKAADGRDRHVFKWLRERNVLPRREPTTKDEALRILDEAIATAAEESSGVVVPDQLVR